MSNASFIPGKSNKYRYPLARYLPELNQGVISGWLKTQSLDSNYLVDPFGISPGTTLEAAQAGYTIIVSVNNPVLQLIYKLFIDPPDQSEIDQVLAIFSTLQVGDTRLEDFINNLYQSNCRNCGNRIRINSFIWASSSEIPHTKKYYCPYCDTGYDDVISEFDEIKSKEFEKVDLHRIRLINRVTGLRSADSHGVTEVLQHYTSRSIFGISTLLNKYENLQITDRQRIILDGLLLILFDRSSKLWSTQSKNERPKILTIPPEYIEENIWVTVEAAGKSLSSLLKNEDIQVTEWPNIPDKSGVCIYPGKFSEFTKELTKPIIGAIIGAFPRPNQAFWWQSAAWSGWLWGPKTAERLYQVYKRSRFDWIWNTGALNSLFCLFSTLRKKPIPFFGIIDEIDQGFLSSAIIASKINDFKSLSVSIRLKPRQIQISGETDPHNQLENHHIAINRVKNINDMIDIGKGFLLDIGEPIEYIYLHGKILTTLKKNLFKLTETRTIWKVYNHIVDNLKKAFSTQNGFSRYKGSEKTLDSGKWWFSGISPEINQSDRIELLVLEQLHIKESVAANIIDKQICNTVTGIYAPRKSLIDVILESYCDTHPDNSELFQLRDSEAPDTRFADIEEIQEIIAKTGRTYGFSVSHESGMNRIFWEHDLLSHEFLVRSTAELCDFINVQSYTGNIQKYLIIPGSRSALISYKLDKNPYLSQLYQTIHIIKFRHIRSLCVDNLIPKENFETKLLIDPISYIDPQLAFL